MNHGVRQHGRDFPRSDGAAVVCQTARNREPVHDHRIHLSTAFRCYRDVYFPDFTYCCIQIQSLRIGNGKISGEPERAKGL